MEKRNNKKVLLKPTVVINGKKIAIMPNSIKYTSGQETVKAQSGKKTKPTKWSPETLKSMVSSTRIVPACERVNVKVSDDNTIKHLRFNYNATILQCGKCRHAQVVMRELGITYQHSTPQSISDQWWFWNCENIPEFLPEYITDLGINDPMEYVGFGLSKEWAEKIRDYKK